MRVVIDTNVLVSALLNPYGTPGGILGAFLAKNFSLVYDDRILKRYREVLTRPFFAFEEVKIEALLEFIEFSAEYANGREVDVVLLEETDLPFLEVAIAGQADAIVTGNARHFRRKHGYHKVQVCTHADFLRLTSFQSGRN